MDWSKTPLDLIVAIIDFAARQDKQTNLCLTHVSTEVQDIADRVLFRDIYLGIDPQTGRMLRRMLSSACSSPRFLRARAYIRSVRAPAGRGISSDLLGLVFHHCPNLQCLVSSGSESAEVSLNPPTSFKTLGFTLLQDMDNWIKQPFFWRITHLVIEENIFVVDHHFRALGMSRLTHIYLGCNKSSAPPWKVVPLPSQLQLCLVFLGFSRRGMTDERFYSVIAQSRFSDIQQGKVDNRFIPVVPYRHSMWAGSQTSRGFLVAPDWGMSESLWGMYPTNMVDRKLLYDWLPLAWTEGERVVKAKEYL
ncbi:hypothetical protein DL96DRAFT_1685336 [Flagelloscypha sp. PMI_526]|nr:hypothetical protein DL96DRAFT_1685336 [Flagelloscypha sp. PMI_526]